MEIKKNKEMNLSHLIIKFYTVCYFYLRRLSYLSEKKQQNVIAAVYGGMKNCFFYLCSSEAIGGLVFLYPYTSSSRASLGCFISVPLLYVFLCIWCKIIDSAVDTVNKLLFRQCKKELKLDWGWDWSSLVPCVDDDEQQCKLDSLVFLSKLSKVQKIIFFFSDEDIKSWPWKSETFKNRTRSKIGRFCL